MKRFGDFHHLSFEKTLSFAPQSGLGDAFKFARGKPPAYKESCMAAKKKAVKKPKGKAKGKGKGGSGAPAPAPSGGFVFAEQKQTPDDFSGFSKQDVLADSSIRGLTTLEPFPASRKPEVLSLDQVLGAAEIAKIKAAG